MSTTWNLRMLFTAKFSCVPWRLMLIGPCICRLFISVRQMRWWQNSTLWDGTRPMSLSSPILRRLRIWWKKLKSSRTNSIRQIFLAPMKRLRNSPINEPESSMGILCLRLLRSGLKRNSSPLLVMDLPLFIWFRRSWSTSQYLTDTSWVRGVRWVLP